MSESERVKRKRVARAGPLRNVSAAFRRAEPAPPQASMPAARDEASILPEAYRIVKEHFEEGRRFASAAEPCERNGGTMNGGTMDPWQYWVAVSQMWMRYLATMVPTPPGMPPVWPGMGMPPWPAMPPGMPGMPPWPGMPGWPQVSSWDLGGPGGAPPTPGPGQVPYPAAPVGREAAPVAVDLVIDVQTSQSHAAEIRLELHDRTSPDLLTADPLVSFDNPTLPPLSAVVLRAVDGRLRVTGAIPASQPVGLYRADLFTIEDRAKAPSQRVRRGALWITLSARPA
jgi:hypothetical protein